MTGRDRTPTDGPTTVVHLITTLTQGGAERVLSQVVPRPDDAPDERHVVVSLADGGMFADELRSAGVEVHGLGMRPGRDLVRGTRRLAALLRELRPTMVVAWMYHACLLAMLARPLAGGARRTRMVWVLRQSLHAPQDLSSHARTIVRVLARASRVPEAIAINTRTGREHHAAAGYRPRRWVDLPNGCDTERFRPDDADRRAVRRELDIPDGTAAVMFVGRDHPQKRLDALLTALPRVRSDAPITLVMAGSGTEQRSGTDGAVRRIGLGDRQDVERLLRGADLLVLPSRTEGTPNAVIEAMATGVPCVVTAVGDSAELVGATGAVVPPDADRELVDAIDRMVALDATSRARLGELARERAIERHALPAARERYRALWEHPA